MFKRIPGTRDILPEEALFWQEIEEASRRIFSLYNYKEIRPPLIEEAALFQRSLGESAEIVQKQMFLIEKDEDVYALRPEGTASIVRAYIENNLDKTSSLAKFYYIGPMFRRERPQKGRLRQFHHLGCEAIGSQDAFLDIEAISLADVLLKANSIEGYKIKINSLGCAKDKKGLIEVLRKCFKSKLSSLCLDCHNRFQNNVLRILDCKNEKCIEVIRKLDISQEYLCLDCKIHFAQVKDGLDNLKIKYQVDPYLVRGLDYYTRTVFEITHDSLGAQNAVGAGGRYDKLISELGGPDVGATGFAFGIERLLLVSKCQSVKVSEKKLVYIITLGEAARKEGLKLLDNLRKADIAADTDYEDKSLKGALRRANDLKARHVLIIGEDEIKRGVVTLKDMVSGEQKEVKQEDLIRELRVV
ncbi:MAG: histidine--tRNA ligase [Candidatus Omnitrophica bacterium]|nr:histidine--tRNA ligase [Candidatus Omnitrophota bacterium]MDD5591665.1 histidine--tRNA ligase [Candidatus Omnitrophota bacterium]